MKGQQHRILTHVTIYFATALVFTAIITTIITTTTTTITPMGV